MSNTSGRVTTLETQRDFPNGEGFLLKYKTRNSDGNAKRKRIALEKFDSYLTKEYPNVALKDVDNTLLEHFSYWLNGEQGLSHSYLQHVFYDVRAYLNDTFDDEYGYLEEEDEYILKWLDSGTKTVHELDKDVHWLPQEKIQELTDGAKNLRNRIVIGLLWHTGCRPSEIARMKDRRTYSDERRIKVKTSKVEDTNKDNYERDVFWSRSLDRDMREYLQRGGRDGYYHADDSPFLIVGYNTLGISARQVNSIVKMAAEEAGIQEQTIETADGVEVNRVTPKTLRHSFAVHSVRGRERSGTPPMDIERLRRLMGHGSMEVTSHYLQYRSSDLRDAHERCHPS